jgi:hypothetical protein
VIARAQHRRERLPLDEFQHQEARQSYGFEAVDSADVGMIERGQHARLALEPCQAIGIAGEFGGQYFDRDVAREVCVVRPVDLPHSAGAQQGVEPVVAEHSAGHVTRHDIVGGGGYGKSGPRQEVFDNRVFEQHFDLTPKVVVVDTRIREEAGALVWWRRVRGVIQRFYPLPTFRCHLPGPRALCLPLPSPANTTSSAVARECSSTGKGGRRRPPTLTQTVCRYLRGTI